MKTRNHTVTLTIVIYATMLLFGLVESIKGVAYPLIQQQFGAPYDAQGALSSLTWFGYVIFCMVAGLFMQRFGIKRAMLAGYILLCVGLAVTMRMPTFWLATAALMLVNTGFGFFEVSTNALATLIFTRRAALMMNLMHFFYGAAAILGPYAAGLLTGRGGLSWQGVYLVAIIPVALAGVAVLAIRFGGQAGIAAAQSAPRGAFVRALRDRRVWLFSAVLGFMEVIEFSAANWGGLYLRDVHGLDPRVQGAAFVAAFYLLFTLSRLIGGPLAEKLGYMRTLVLGTAAAVALYAAGFALGAPGLRILPFTGLCIGVMWPTLMAVAQRVFGADAPHATAAVITISGAINGIFQLVIGLTNRYIGAAWGYRSALVYALLALGLLLWLAAKIRRAQPVGDAAA